MTPATLTALLTAAVKIYEAVEKEMDESTLPVGDPDFDRAMKAFQAHQLLLGQRFEAAMIRLKK